MKYLSTYKLFEASDVFSSILLSEPTIISGKTFKEEFLTTDSESIEKAFFEDDAGSLGSSLGKGSYFSVTQYSVDHYESDDYFTSSRYYSLQDDAKILLVPNTTKYRGEELAKMANKFGADGIYDPQDGNDGVPYLGLCVYNLDVIEEE